MTDLNTALAHLEAGDWEAAHTIVQADESELASWMHAVVHLMERDQGNADYWFRRAGRPRNTIENVAEELKALRSAFDDM